MNPTAPKVYIKLVNSGKRKQDVLNVLSRIQGLRDSPEQLVAEIPCYISEQVSTSLAQKVKMYLEKAGATVELHEKLPAHPGDLYNTSLPLPDSPGYDIAAVDSTEALPNERYREQTSYTDAEYAERLAQVTDISEPVSPKRRRRSTQRNSSRGMKILIIALLLIFIAFGGVWMLMTGQFERLARTYQQNPVVGQVGVLEISNPEQAEIRVFHVIGTRVITPIPFEGDNVRLKQGDYYVEARKGNQELQFPVYIEGRGHRLHVEVAFPVKQPPSDKSAYVPAGWFRMGNKETDVAHFGFPDERPDIDVYVSGFYLSKYEVTNREFAQFVQAGGYENEVYWDRLVKDWPSLVEQVPAYGRIYGNDGWASVNAYIHARFIDTDDRPGPRLWEDDQPPYEYLQDDHPVTGISLYEAEAYCQWMTQQTGMIHRLPTEAEWEKAARGYEGYFFSYGNEYDPDRANTEVGNTRPVGSYPPNSYGLYDMTGSVWEWVQDQYRANAYQLLLEKYQTEIRNPLLFDESTRYDRLIVRGGSYRSVNRINARTPVRYPMFPNDWHTNIGFRYVVVP